MIKYALMLNDTAMILVNLVGTGLNVIYLAIYYFYSSNKNQQVHKPLSCGIGLIAVLFGYAEWEDPSQVEYRYGMIVMGLLIALMAEPLLGIVSFQITNNPTLLVLLCSSY